MWEGTPQELEEKSQRLRRDKDVLASELQIAQESIAGLRDHISVLTSQLERSSQSVAKVERSVQTVETVDRSPSTRTPPTPAISIESPAAKPHRPAFTLTFAGVQPDLYASASARPRATPRYEVDAPPESARGHYFESAGAVDRFPTPRDALEGTFTSTFRGNWRRPRHADADPEAPEATSADAGLAEYFPLIEGECKLCQIANWADHHLRTPAAAEGALPPIFHQLSEWYKLADEFTRTNAVWLSGEEHATIQEVAARLIRNNRPIWQEGGEIESMAVKVGELELLVPEITVPVMNGSSATAAVSWVPKQGQGSRIWKPDQADNGRCMLTAAKPIRVTAYRLDHTFIFVGTANAAGENLVVAVASLRTCQSRTLKLTNGTRLIITAVNAMIGGPRPILMWPMMATAGSGEAKPASFAVASLTLDGDATVISNICGALDEVRSVCPHESTPFLRFTSHLFAELLVGADHAEQAEHAPETSAHFDQGSSRSTPPP
jgi:hypothetical protein